MVDGIDRCVWMVEDDDGTESGELKMMGVGIRWLVQWNRSGINELDG